MFFTFSKAAILVTALAAAVSASPLRIGPDSGVVEKDNCAHKMRSCFADTCNGEFANSDAVIGRCTGGAYRSCPCDKCGSGHGYIGFCSQNGCKGRKATCTAGRFQGCPCTEDRDMDDPPAEKRMDWESEAVSAEEQPFWATHSVNVPAQ